MHNLVCVYIMKQNIPDYFIVLEFDKLSERGDQGIVSLYIFKASALWADAFYKSKYPSACLCVRLCVRLSVSVFTFDVLFKRLFGPTS